MSVTSTSLQPTKSVVMPNARRLEMALESLINVSPLPEPYVVKSNVLEAARSKTSNGAPPLS